MQFGAQQEVALAAVEHWLQRWQSGDQRKQFFYIGGYAGTGKTTIAKETAKFFKKGTTQFGAFTGKAALQLKKAGCDNAATIHSLIYIPVFKKDKKTGELILPLEILRWELGESENLERANFVVVDEVSMINEEMAKDLLSFNKPVLVLGDPAQLPPVGGEGYFTRGQPDAMLTEIHRQALDNPIIRLSMLARQGKEIKVGSYGKEVVITDRLKSKNDLEWADQIICGKNDTRKILNATIRELADRKSVYPEIGERLIGLKNNRAQGVFNGGTYIVDEFLDEPREDYFRWHKIKVTSLDLAKELKCQYETACFNGDHSFSKHRLSHILNSQFDFGYAITCHKSQGSQWDRVLVRDESFIFGENRHKWLYTAITRSSEKLVIWKQ